MCTDRIDILEKIIYIDSCLIGGCGLKIIIQNESNFFRKESGADIIIVCIENQHHVDIELVLEEKNKFSLLMEKHNIAQKHMKLDKFLDSCNGLYSNSQKYIKLENISSLFEGIFSKHESENFANDMSFKEAYLFPIHKKVIHKIGFILYFFTKETEVSKERLLLLTQIFETLISPFYDDKNYILHGKCIQVDSEMRSLTQKEKEVVHGILLGKSNNDLAEELGISINTLKTHMKSIFNKYCVNSKVELQSKLLRNF